jgi:polysaccharide pyruvyl transferase WcaK-like protein
VVEAWQRPRKVLGIVNAAADVVISMRFHGLVFGLVTGTPVINIGSSRKNADLMSEAGLADATLDWNALSAERIVAAVERAPGQVARIEAYRAAAVARLEPLREQLRAVYGGPPTA